MKHSYSKLLVSLSLSAAPLLLVIACDSGSTGDGASSLQDALKLGDVDGDGVLSAGERDVLSSKCHARGEPSHEAEDAAAADDDEADALDDEVDETADAAEDIMTTEGDAESEDDTESDDDADADSADDEGETEGRDAAEDDASDHERFHAVCTELFADDDEEEDESDDTHGGSHRD